MVKTTIFGTPNVECTWIIGPKPHHSTTFKTRYQVFFNTPFREPKRVLNSPISTV
jgi:hypothetical protein